VRGVALFPLVGPFACAAAFTFQTSKLTILSSVPSTAASPLSVIMISLSTAWKEKRPGRICLKLLALVAVGANLAEAGRPRVSHDSILLCSSCTDRMIPLYASSSNISSSLVLPQAIANNLASALPQPFANKGRRDTVCHRELATTCHPSGICMIRIESTSSEPIQMFKRLAFSDAGKEVATKEVATQSSLLYNNPKYAASKATDGDEMSFSHVNLSQDYSIRSICIKNRWCKDKDDAPGCLCGLSNAKLSLLDGKVSLVKLIDTGDDTCGKLELEYGFSYPCDTEVSVLWILYSWFELI
jgi:hypothetical protein